MKKIKITHVIAIVSAAVFFSSCSIFGLDLQEKYDFDGSTQSNQMNMKAWEFIKSRTDLFQYFIDAVEYAEVDTTLFDRSGITVFPLTNDAISAEIDESTSNNVAPGGYWSRNPVNGIVPLSWDSYPKEVVKQLVLNHIMKYAMSFNELIKETKGARTFFPTEATNGYGYISLRMLNSTETTSGSDASKLWVNDFPSHYTKLNPSGQSAYINPRSSNLKTSNGSYVHVMDNYLDFPIDSDFETTPIYNK